jgi:acyl-coenzyme A thioesterase PaaI-like protein
MSPLEFTREYQKKIPFIQHLKIQTDELGKGTARLSLPVTKELTNSLGTAHGGVIMSLLDVALCTAARTLHPDSIGVIPRGAVHRGAHPAPGLDRRDHHRPQHLVHRRRERRAPDRRRARSQGWA